MARKAIKRRDELWIRTAAISSVRTSVRSHAIHQRGSEAEIESRCLLELSGLLDGAVRDVTDIEIHLYPEDNISVGTARTASVDAIIGFRPQLKLIVYIKHRNFDRLWSMALAGHLGYAYLSFTKPRYAFKGLKLSHLTRNRQIHVASLRLYAPDSNPIWFSNNDAADNRFKILITYEIQHKAVHRDRPETAGTEQHNSWMIAWRKPRRSANATSSVNTIIFSDLAAATTSASGFPSKFSSAAVEA